MIHLTAVTRIMVEDFLPHVLRDVPVDQGGAERYLYWILKNAW